MHSKPISTAVVMLALGLTGTACREEPQPEVQQPMPAGQAMEGSPAADPVPGMHMDAGMMRRHAEEMDQMTTEMRPHLAQMRQLQPAEWHARMGEHAGRVSRMLTLMERQMREMRMGMDAEHMGQMMGMSGEEHRQMMSDMQALRAEVEQLQTASGAEVRQRMPAHLDRLERMVQMMEQSAAHMRDM